MAQRRLEKAHVNGRALLSLTVDMMTRQLQLNPAEAAVCCVCAARRACVRSGSRCPPPPACLRRS